MGERLGVQQALISKWETGKRSRPRIDTLKRIAEALGVNLQWLISGEGAMEDLQISDKESRVNYDRNNLTSQLRDLKDLDEQKKRELGKRLLVMREAAFRTQARLAEELGIDASLVSRWESGERVPDEGIFEALVRILQVNLTWLLSGEGQMWCMEVPGIKYADSMRRVPILGVVPGSDPFAPGLVPEGSIFMPDEISKHPRAFALRAIDNSMTPKIEDGDLVFIEPLDGNTPRLGSIVIALLGEETTCKVFKRTSSGQLVLTPLNPAFEPLYPAEKDRMLGVVVGITRAFKPLI